MEHEMQNRIIRSIQSELGYPKGDELAEDDYIFGRLGEIATECALTVDEAQEVFNSWRRVFLYEGRE